jgi:hypothetical protein
VNRHVNNPPMMIITFGAAGATSCYGSGSVFLYSLSELRRFGLSEIGRSENGRLRRMVERRMVASGDWSFGDWSFGDWSFREWSFGEWTVYRLISARAAVPAPQCSLELSNYVALHCRNSASFRTVQKTYAAV